MKRRLFGLITFCIILSAAYAAPFTLSQSNSFPVDTEIINREASTYFIYDQIDTVEIINSDRKTQKIKLKKDEYTYDTSTGKLSFKIQIPYENCYVHMDGIPARPYTCYLKDFEGHKSELLVILNNLTAIEKKDYVYDPAKKLLVFRSDIDISKISYYMVYYVQTANGVVSKQISNDFNDTIAELRARHSQELFGGPLVIYKDRTGVNPSKIAKEVGFKIPLLMPKSCTICETYDNNQKKVVVYCVYKNKVVECSENKTTEYRNY
ncbi:MAG: hypothetical protein K5907_03895 [Treponema sp.]|nr:hypothetical protein [Treponema sp.]